MTAPSQTPEAAGLEVVDLNGLLHQAWQRLYRSEADVPGALVVLNALHVALETPLVTSASAQAAIDAEKARADRLAKALEPFARVARWARLCGMSDLEKATAKYAKRNLFWDQFSAADAALNGDAEHAG